MSSQAISTNNAVPCAVLDTNVVLDWLLFLDHSVAPLADAVQSGGLHWLACPRMRDEFAHTLLRPELSRWQPDSPQLLTRFDNHVRMLEARPAPSSLRCTDPEDQVFIDLALHTGATWLVSHDRALLKLRGRAARLGLKIVRPADWSPA